MARGQRHRCAVYHLYHRRTSIHLSAATVAQQVGVCETTYRDWEQGKTNPSREHRRALARVLRTTQTYLCDGNLSDGA